MDFRQLKELEAFQIFFSETIPSKDRKPRLVRRSRK